MALTVTTDLTRITDAETITGWTTYGAGGAGAQALEPDYFAQGSNCISRGVTGAATNKGMCFDYGAGNVLNFNTTHAGKLVFIWMRTSTPGLCDTRANGGIRIVLGSGTTAPADAAGVWSSWYVDGSDTIDATVGWKCYMIDPSLPASTTFGGGVDLTAVRWFGGVMRSTGTVKGQNFGIDAVGYGFGELRVNGTNTTAGAGFQEIAAADFGTIANRYGVSRISSGVIFVQGRIVLGDSVGTAATAFTSSDETVVWSQQVYYDGTRERPSVKDFRPDGTAYLGITRVGNATNNTNVTIGSKVGTGATASGRSGGTFSGPRQPAAFVGQSGTVKSTSALLVYGAQFIQFRGGIDLSGNVATDEWMGGGVTASGTFQSGKVLTKRVNFVNNLGGVYKFLEDFKNDSASNEALATADPRVDWANCVGGTQFTVPTGVPYVRLDSAADVRNVVKINSDVVGSDDHEVEAIIRFPTGSNQGIVGLIFRASSTLATENYWFLKLDRPNNQISLVRCDAGTDTVVVGPTSFTLSADTDYLAHLRGSGATIEGFVNGTILTTTSSTYQTNRWVGIRGTTNTSQSASAEPRISYFGCGPQTQPHGACTFSNSTDAAVASCSFLNNTRALTIAGTGTYAVTGYSMSGNLVGVRNSSNGAVTVNASSGDSPETTIENLGSGSVTVNNSINLTIEIRDSAGTLITSACEVTVVKSSDVSILYQVESLTSGSTVYAYNYVSDTAVYINVVNVASYVPKTVDPIVLGNTNQTVSIQLEDERGRYSNP